MGIWTPAKGLFVASLVLATTWANAQTVSLRPTLEEEVIDTKIGGRGLFSMGFYADSEMPLTSTYSLLSSSGHGKYSYQVPVGVGLDFSIGLSPRWELGASIGYQKYEVREIGSGAKENFVTGGYTSIPLRLLIRHRWPEKIVAPEMELALGAAFQTNTVSSTVLNAASFRQSRIAPYGHLGGGIAYAWGNDLTIHFIGGYSVMMNGKASYDGGSNFKVQSNSLVHGFFTKGMVRLQF